MVPVGMLSKGASIGTPRQLDISRLQGLKKGPLTQSASRAEEEKITHGTTPSRDVVVSPASGDKEVLEKH